MDEFINKVNQKVNLGQCPTPDVAPCLDIAILKDGFLKHIQKHTLGHKSMEWSVWNCRTFTIFYIQY